MTNPFHNIHNELLADTLGDLDAKIKALQVEAKLVKTELHDRKVETVAGERFQVTRTETTRVALNQKALKEEFDQAWFDARSTFTTVESLRITVRKDVLGRAA
tara:strand:- start:1440 stop:1748 length:309 start_codon:yes stop_codon:yes gene_type:complete